MRVLPHDSSNAQYGPPVTTIGERLRQRRLELKSSQRALASPGVSYAYISRIEAGTRQPSVKALRQLAAKLGVSVHWLETGNTDPAEELARIVLDTTDALPPHARRLARAILREAPTQCARG